MLFTPVGSWNDEVYQSKILMITQEPTYLWNLVWLVGWGACYACVLKVPDSETISQRVCEDGPVFRTGTVVL